VSVAALRPHVHTTLIVSLPVLERLSARHKHADCFNGTSEAQAAISHGYAAEYYRATL
jgi:hypothetical protein